VPVQRCTSNLPIPLFPLWTVRPVQSLSACTTVQYNFTYTSTPPMDRTASTGTQCLSNGALYLYLYLYSLYGPYGLYRASVPVQRCSLLYLYLYSPLGPYGLYTASVPVQRYTLTLPLPLLPLWTVRPVQSLSACTTVHITFTYTSNSSIDRTACTEPQCLYNVALYLYLYLYSPMDRTACTEPQCLYICER